VKILIVTYSYTPDLTPRAFRWSAVASELVKMGHEVHVLCAGCETDETNAAGGRATEHRVKDWFLNASTRVTPNSTTHSIAGGTGRALWWKSLARKWVRSIWRSSCWPDYACGWVVPGALAARALCAQHHFDWVISVSHPFTGHVAGWLATRGAQHTKWLVDIGDPFSLMSEPAPNNLTIYARLNRYIESRVIARAQMISVTTEATRRLYETHFPLSAAKMHVIPPLLSLPEPRMQLVRGINAPIRLVFVGTLYSRLRSPRRLLECFAALVQAQPQTSLELHFYGSVNDCAEQLSAHTKSADSKVHVHGLVNRQTAFQAMYEADILVNIGNESESQLASKVIEYMAMGKPILNFISIANDTSVEALTDYPNTLTVAHTSQADLTPAMFNALCKFVLLPPPHDPTAAQRIRAQYSTEKVTRMYATLLEQSAS
jgi:glycosyltransferase involved in cell wall biosynthesis